MIAPAWMEESCVGNTGWSSAPFPKLVIHSRHPLARTSETRGTRRRDRDGLARAKSSRRLVEHLAEPGGEVAAPVRLAEKIFVGDRLPARGGERAVRVARRVEHPQLWPSFAQPQHQ